MGDSVFKRSRPFLLGTSDAVTHDFQLVHGVTFREVAQSKRIALGTVASDDLSLPGQRG